ncbi:MAG: hypothetical protein KKB03_01090 [Nanoarchaeota archaeon]|nr:hypothetical protein [Nanoarchaeota archaeon]MBU2519822.1 hypothetical protein [Nanoarchaeota archaeon]
MGKITVVKVGPIVDDHRPYIVLDDTEIARSYYAPVYSLLRALNELGISDDVILEPYNGLDDSKFKQLVEDSKDPEEEKKYKIRVLNEID